MPFTQPDRGEARMPFTQSDTEKLAAQVKRAEGFRLAAYRCPAGALTVGYGHNCGASPVPGVREPGDSISPRQAETLFEADLAAAVWAVRRHFPWVAGLIPARQAVLYDMAFNMGIGGLASFVNTLRMIKEDDYAGAARNMLLSKWARQVGKRAIRLSRQMETGEWQ